MRIVRTTVGTGVLACLLALTVGCGGGKSNASGGASQTPSSTPTTATTTPAPSITPTPTPTPSTTPSASRSGTPTAPPCTIADLHVTVRPGGGAAGSVFSTIVYTNVSTAACSTGGYGGISYVDSAGKQVGAPAQRTPATATVFVLAPGGRATQQLQEGEAENYPASTCHPSPTTGLRIYPPNETHSVVVAHQSVGCMSAKVKLLDAKPLRKR